MRRAGVVLLIVLSASGARTTLAGLDDFVPRPSENGAYLDIFYSHERDTNSYGDRTSRWTDDFLREKLTVLSNGYFYHPRFMLYDVSLSGALKQENYDASFLEPIGWTSDSGLEYDAHTYFLPEHPYNLELYAQRYEPLFKEQTSTQRNSVETGYGALFHYRLRPFFFDARFSTDNIDTGLTESDVTRVGLNGEYFKQFGNGNAYTFVAAHNPSRFSDSLGLEGSTVEQFLSNVVDLQFIKLTVAGTSNRTEQESPGTGSFDTDQVGFYEILTAYLTDDLRTDLTYRIQDNDSTFEDRITSVERNLSDHTDFYELDIVHQLYDSLDTIYRFQRNDRTSTDGESRSTNNLLNFNYTKSIPRGRVNAGMNFGRGVNENEGRTDIVNEPHPATPVPSIFLLNQINGDPRSVEVFLRNPLPPFDIIQLVETLHFLVIPVGNQLEINILTLPPQFAVPGTYDLSVTYSLLGGDFELTTDSFGYNASVQLLDDLLTPYFGYARVSSEETAGTFPGIPVDSTSYTAGLRFHKDPVRGRGEYQEVNWDVSPYRSWRGEVQVVSNLDATTRIYATGAYLNKYFREGTTAAFDDPYTETSVAASGSFQKQFLQRAMLMAFGGSWTQTRSLVDTTAVSLNASMSWRVGLLDLTVGANAYTSDSEGTASIDTERTDQYYYVKVRRDFF